ncbi:IST1 homolog isoform X3 [Tribolium castaneum]|uniref:IST1 homolog n=1 Tax=Tribolium castaneum TaxID=7070 RepID=D6WJC2_TRICA|nr:PREDICTED: IST1 homolog isoform X3 [Tribolium castaneum]EFA04455.2 IST1 homolog-like Protein [Tribolium castaneum]|eukprot:XP_008194058.1 PREDICTED: IST1 homolog isoform X3 [Tribolium castaneum]
MFSSAPNYTKLKTNLRLVIARLKLLEKKKTELTEKSRREIADFIAAGKIERAKIRVEYIIREDYLVEAMEIVEMYCDLLLARFGLITNMKELDEGIAEAVSSLIWVAPRLQSDCQELKVIADLLTAKYGQNYAEACRIESVETISEKLKHKLSIQSPAKLLVEKYVIEIAKSYNVPYEPDPQVMELEKGKDALLIDLSDKNNLGGGGGYPAPLGFLGYPQPPPLPAMVDPPPAPFSYPPSKDQNWNAPSNPSAPPPAFSYNIPPADEGKESNTDFMGSLPTYSMVCPRNNLQNNDEPQKPTPQQKLNDNSYNLPELPSVPSHNGPPSPDASDDIDFDDLTRRFNELKKKY